MRVTIVSKALVVGAYQKKLQELASCPDIQLTAIVPPSWRDGRREQRLERLPGAHYQLLATPIAFNGRFHLHFYPRLPRILASLRPDILHIDEEPYNLATYLALRAGQRVGARTLFFSWQNLHRRYPLPFRLMERYAYAHADAAVAGTSSAADVLRDKGYRGDLAVIPQFGVDPEVFAPRRSGAARQFTIGYAGRLVEEKGLRVLLEALALLQGPWRLAMRGSGPMRDEISSWFASRSQEGRLDLAEHLPSTEMPAFLNTLDLLVLPSLTRPNWKEQFGRVLIEAMACGVPVVGSDSGEIPAVIGEGGLVFPEGQPVDLAGHLAELRADPARRAALGRLGRERVLARFTQAQIAAQTVALYRRMLGTTPPQACPQ